MTSSSDLDTTFAKTPSLRQKEATSILKKVYHEYCKYEVWDLVVKSHYGPWQKARNGLSEEETSTTALDLKELMDFANAQK